MRNRRRKGQCVGCVGLGPKRCMREAAIRLSDYKPGDKGAILCVVGDKEFRRRMTELGFVKGAEIKVVKYAPLTDPVEFVIKGYHVTLRRHEAADILMDQPEQAA